MKRRDFLKGGVKGAAASALLGYAALNVPTALAGNGAGRSIGESDNDLEEGSIELEDLLFMREEEKLARDVYLALYDKWGVEVFYNIAQSEQEHTDAMASLILKYGYDDPVVEDIPGVFVNTNLQALYNALMLIGETSVIDALTVGCTIEDKDIKDIQNCIEHVDNSEIIRSYEHLIAGSMNHMRAFYTRLLEEGVTYEPQFISQEDFEDILAADHGNPGDYGS